VEIAVWLIAGVFALNALVLGLSVLLVTPGRHRARREVRQLEALWRLGPTGHRHVRKTVALCTLAALVFGVMAVGIRKPERLVTSALGVVLPVILGGDAGPDRVEVRADVPVRSGSGVVDAGSRPGGSTTVDAGPPLSGSGSANEQTAPTVVEARPRSSSVIRVSWSDVPGATGYDLERSTSPVAGFLTVATTEDDVTAYVDAGLSPEETYFYRVLVLLEDGIPAPPSDVVSATTLVLPPAATVLQATVQTSTTVVLTWDDVADESSYRIERSADGETDWIAIGTTGQDVTTYEDAGLEPATAYFYRVFATNEGGSSPASAVVAATTGDGGVIGDGVVGDGAPGDGALDGERSVDLDPAVDLDPSVDPSTVVADPVADGVPLAG
jgi:hypothetical protein